MTYAIEILKEKLRDEVIYEAHFSRIQLTTLAQRETFEMIVQRKLDLEKALEVLGREKQ